MKSILVILASLMLFSATVYVTAVPEIINIPGSGVCVVEFNASFNSGNSINWLDNFSDGEEIERFQANIMMELEATEEDVQEVIDEILMSSF